MTKEEQMEIVAHLVEGLQMRCLSAIAEDRVPEAWNGFELRHWLADLSAEQTLPMDRARLRRYRNTRLINNL